MNITYLIGSLAAGGKERQLIYLLRELSKEHNIQLIIFNENIFYKEILALTITIKAIPLNKKYSLNTFKLIYKTLKRFQPTIIHSWSNNITLLTLPYLILHPKLKLVSSIRYAGKLKKSFKGKITKILTWSRSSAFVSNSKRGLEVENLSNNPKGIVIHNGIDLISFDSNSKEIKEDLKQFDRFIKKVVMIGRFYPSKDYITFIKSAKLISQNNKEICFLCIGNGPKRFKAENEAKHFLNKNIFFLGNRKDIPSLINKMDIGVLLNNINGHAEGISNVIMEYMAAGLPVVATNAGGTPDLIQNNVSGFLVPAFDQNIVTEKILYLINNPRRAREMGQAGREIIKNDFSSKKMTDSYLKLYELISNKN